MKLVCTNTNKLKDHFIFSFEELAKDTNIDIAVPFFTNSDVLEAAIDNGCSIRLVVRLGDSTSPHALSQLIDNNNISLRYLTSKNFHPKLYIFGEDFAFVGSSNLTRAGLTGNQEINVSIPSDDPRFDVLRETFEDYWDSAEVLTQDVIGKYTNIYGSFSVENGKNTLSNKVIEAFGEIVVKNGVEIVKKRTSVSAKFESDFLKKYQLFLKKYRVLEEIYNDNGKFKVERGSIPLHLEIDQFLSWVRGNRAQEDLYLKAISKEGDALRDIVVENICDFCHDAKEDYIFEIRDNIWPRLTELLASPSVIDNLSKDELFEAFRCIHAFNSGAYRYLGGGDVAKSAFFTLNDLDRVKNTIIYLLFGDEDYQKRIAKCVFDQDYKLDRFGESCVKELFGWQNKNNIPICNGRTLKSMRWLGFGKL